MQAAPPDTRRTFDVRAAHGRRQQQVEIHSDEVVAQELAHSALEAKGPGEHLPALGAEKLGREEHTHRCQPPLDMQASEGADDFPPVGTPANQCQKSQGDRQT